MVMIFIIFTFYHLPEIITTYHCKCILNTVTWEIVMIFIMACSSLLKTWDSQVKAGAVCPGELQIICEKGLLLITVTVPEMEVFYGVYQF